MQFSEKISIWVIISAVMMICVAFAYDNFVGGTACIICLFQRFLLMILILFSVLNLFKGWKKGIYLVSALGLLLDLRHSYVVLFPSKISRCMPFELLMNLPFTHMISQFVIWLSQLGRDCSMDVDPITYVMIVGLAVYYSLVMTLVYKYNNYYPKPSA